jgi:hypothetical protein
MAVFGLLSFQVLVAMQSARVRHSVNKEWGVKENHVVNVKAMSCIHVENYYVLLRENTFLLGITPEKKKGLL